MKGSVVLWTKESGGHSGASGFDHKADSVLRDCPASPQFMFQPLHKPSAWDAAPFKHALVLGSQARLKWLPTITPSSQSSWSPQFPHTAGRGKNEPITPIQSPSLPSLQGPWLQGVEICLKPTWPA